MRLRCMSTAAPAGGGACTPEAERPQPRVPSMHHREQPAPTLHHAPPQEGCPRHRGPPALRAGARRPMRSRWHPRRDMNAATSQEVFAGPYLTDEKERAKFSAAFIAMTRVLPFTAQQRRAGTDALPDN